jgi:hypothetical protein
MRTDKQTDTLDDANSRFSQFCERVKNPSYLKHRTRSCVLFYVGDEADVAIHQKDKLTTKQVLRTEGNRTMRKIT